MGQYKIGNTVLAREDDNILHLYVRAVDGDDDNPGTDPDYPVATWGAAFARIPYFNPLTVIHVGAHTGEGYDPESLGPLAMLEHVIVIGDGGGAVGDDGFTELLASTPAITGSSKSKIVMAGGMTTDEHQQYTVEVLTGAAAGDRRTVTENSASEITPCLKFSSAVANGDTFRVVKPSIRVKPEQVYEVGTDDGPPGPAVRMCGTGDPGYASAVGSKAVWLVNLQFWSVRRTNHLFFPGSNVKILGCHFDDEYGAGSQGFWWLGGLRSRMDFGYEALDFTGVTLGWDPVVPTAVDVFSAPNSRSWAGWGVGCADFMALSEIHAEGLWTGVYLNVQDRSFFRMRGGRLNGILMISSGKGSEIEVVGYDGDNNLPIKLKGSALGVLANLGGKVTLNAYQTGAISVETDATGLWAADAGSLIYISNREITGTAGEYGMQVTWGGAILSTNREPAIVGTLGDITIDRGATTKTNAELAAGTILDGPHGRIARFD